MQHLTKYLTDLRRINASVRLVSSDDESSLRPSTLADSVGVIPSKLLLPAAQVAGHMQHATVLPVVVCPGLCVLDGEIGVLGHAAESQRQFVKWRLETVPIQMIGDDHLRL